MSVVAITGVGAITALGRDAGALWDAVLAGRSGIRATDRAATPELAGYPAALLDEALFSELLARARDAGVDPCAEVALAAAREALGNAGITRVAPARVAIVVGTSGGGIVSRSRHELEPGLAAEDRSASLARSAFHAQAAVIAEALGIAGPRLTVSTACASSAHAIGHARDLLDEGLADVVLAGGADVITAEIFAGFHAMGAMSRSPCAPFSEPRGMSLGEGAGFVVLERVDDARARGAAPIALVLGHGTSWDAHHATAPDPTGAGLARAMAAALDDAQIPPAAIGWVNAHGTGTDANDPAEWRAIQRAFGARAAALPVSASKSYLGHTLGAAGVLELIMTALSLRARVIPPTLGFSSPRGGGPPDPVAERVPRAAHAELAISTSAAFGGANACLVVGAPEALRAKVKPASLLRDRVVILGAGAIAAHGHEALGEAVERNEPVGSKDGVARVPRVPIERFVRGPDARALDPTARYLTVAAGLALEHAGVRVRGPLRDRAGLFAGAGWLPWDAANDFWGGIRARGFAGASASAFSRIVLNAPAGAVARALSLRGPSSLFAGGQLSALVAVAGAALALSRRDDADLCVAGAADVIGEGALVEHARRFPGQSGPARGEGAACFALARAGWADREGLRAIARLGGIGLSGPEGLAIAIRQALDAAGVAPSKVGAVFGATDGTEASSMRENKAIHDVLGPRAISVPRRDPGRVLGVSDALAGLSLAAALDTLARSEHALVIACDPIAGSAAILLER